MMRDDHFMQKALDSNIGKLCTIKTVQWYFKEN